MTPRPSPGRAAAWTAVLLAILVGGCSGVGQATGPLSGRTRAYAPAEPALDLEAVPMLTDDGAEVQVTVGLIPATLVFRRVRGEFVAVVSTEFQRRDARGRPVAVSERRDSVRVLSLEATRTYETHRLTDVFPADGVAAVRVRVVDGYSGRETTRTQRIKKPPGAEGPWIGPIRLTQAGAPAVKLHLTAGDRDAAAEFQVRLTEASCVRTLLVAYVTDRAPAEPPYGLTTTVGSLVYRGVSRDRADTLRTEDQVLPTGTHALQMALPSLLEGVYRLVAESGSSYANGECAFGGEDAVWERRDFVVREPDFPRMARLTQLVEPLAYIATPEELGTLRRQVDAAALKRAFDAFWGRIVDDPSDASTLIARYFGRVEEANLAFSAYTDGWRTDRGMVYTVMGPPLFVENGIETLYWFYSYDQTDSSRRFAFDRVMGHDDDLDLPQYVLSRTMDVEREWRLAVLAWRRAAGR